MNNIEMKFYCDDSFIKGDDEKWSYLLDYAFNIAEQVEFNILYPNQELLPEILAIENYLVEKSNNRNKIYKSGYSLKYQLNDLVKTFILSKKYFDWNNYYLEDISFLKEGKEFLATITHENYIILQMTEKQRLELNEKGFNFWCDWGIDPLNENKEE